jgi:CRISPR/Cas system-associated exonuclease Cas4 (RecB family)
MIKDIISCPTKGYFRLQGGGDSLPSQEALAGTIVHDVLENTWSSRDDAEVRMQKLLEEYQLRRGVTNVKRCIDNYFEMFGGVMTPEDEIEKSFKYQYLPDVAFTGRIDRIHNHVIYDWKTGDAPPEDIDKDIQFIMYFLAYKKLYGRDPSATMYVSLAHKKLYSYVPNKAYVDEFTNEIVPYVIRVIKEKKFPRLGFYSWGTCKRCFYREACTGKV